jgi:hypothetical protein
LWNPDEAALRECFSYGEEVRKILSQ